ncbi:MAG: hypothetical protein FWE32_07515 [Oscillospiraceae bacterium]|nr:hypothetical protein [Oscillospiraceae bacterium]
MLDFNRVLIARSECITFQIVKLSSESKGWIGGNIPEYFLNQEDFIIKYRNDYYFYLSFVNPFDNEKMFSIFIPKDKKKLFNEKIYPNCSVLLFEHISSKESNNTDFTNSDIAKHSISDGDISSNIEVYNNDEGDITSVSNSQTVSIHENEREPFLIKFGGTPELIQEESYYYDKLDEDGLGFLFQIDENGYPTNEDFLKGSYPFCFGSLYVYANINSSSIKNPSIGFWQFS